MKRFLWAAMVAVACGGGFLPAAAVDLHRLSVHSDTSKPAPERIGILYDLLLEEIKTPTREHRGWGGGVIDHDYVVTQEVGALKWVARETPEAQTALQAKVAAEKNTEAREAGMVALALTDSSAVNWTEILTLMGKTGQPFLRAQACDALTQADPVLALPELVHALNDRNAYTPGGDVGDLAPLSYPVRRAAAGALRAMGVAVKNRDGMSFTADRDSVVRCRLGFPGPGRTQDDAATTGRTRGRAC